MRITDPKVKKLLKRANSPELDEHIEAYPDDEIEGQTELSILMDEVLFLIWKYEEEGYIQYEDLQYAREVIRDTDDGKLNKLLLPDLKFKYSYDDILEAREVIGEYDRLKKIAKECGYS